MISYKLTESQEHKLRVDYVNSGGYDYESYSGYRDYVVATIPGVVEVAYLGGDNPQYIESLLFENEKDITFFILKYEGQYE